MKKADIWKLFERIVHYYPAFSGDEEKVNAWHDVLKDIPYELGSENLIRYARVEPKWAPTPAELARSLEPAKEQIAIYHDHLRIDASTHFDNLDLFRITAAPPSESVKERMREIAKRNAAR